MRNNPFSVAIDGSGDTGIEKMNPPTVCLFDVNDGVVCTQFLDRCMSSSSTAEGIFAKMQEVLSTHGISWSNCAGIGVDNTSVNMGCRNSIKTLILQENPATYVMRFLYHIAGDAL